MALRLSEGLGSTACMAQMVYFFASHCACRSALRQEQSRYSASAAPAWTSAWRRAPCSAASTYATFFFSAVTSVLALRFGRTLSSSSSSRRLPSRWLPRCFLAASGDPLILSDSLTALTDVWLFDALASDGTSHPGSAPTGEPTVGRIVAVHSRRQAHFLLETCSVEFVLPNVRAKLATTAWRAGQQAQIGAKPQRLMASVTRRWRSA